MAKVIDTGSNAIGKKSGINTTMFSKAHRTLSAPASKTSSSAKRAATKSNVAKPATRVKKK